VLCLFFSIEPAPVLTGFQSPMVRSSHLFFMFGETWRPHKMDFVFPLSASRWARRIQGPVSPLNARLSARPPHFSFFPPGNCFRSPTRFSFDTCSAIALESILESLAVITVSPDPSFSPSGSRICVVPLYSVPVVKFPLSEVRFGPP